MPIIGGADQTRIIGRTLSKGVLCSVLVLLIGFPSAEAVPLIGHKKPKQHSLPPAAQVSPGLMQPQAPANKPPEQPVPVEPLKILVNKGVFPPDAATRAEPISRAEWAAILVKAIGHNTSLVSEFPFYRDVPATHPSYVPIEVAREKKLIVHNGDHGYYYPDRALTYGEAYASIAQAITGPPPAEEQVPHLLQGFSDREKLPHELGPAVAKMVRVHFFRTPVPQTTLQAEQPLSFQGATPLVTYLIHLNERRAPLQKEAQAAVPILPPGLSLELSPSTAILEAQMVVGQGVSFSLVKPVGKLPKETRFEGLIVDSQPAARRYTIQLTEAKTPEGDEFQTNAELTMGFSPRSRITFFVPGELFTTVTQLPANVTAEETPENPSGPPSAIPGATTPQEKAVPPLTPPAGANKSQSPKPASQPVVPPSAQKRK